MGVSEKLLKIPPTPVISRAQRFTKLCEKSGKVHEF
jgi:hypothetical protein